MVGRTTTLSRTVREQFPPRQHDLEYNINLQQALALDVPYMRVTKKLGWLATNRPGSLEILMDQFEPGTIQFWAVCLVYNEYMAKALIEVEQLARKVQSGTKQGIANSPRRKTWQSRPRPHLNEAALLATN